jgi:choline kinase
MQALILAAGRGTRLDPGGTPKCLLDIGGRPLIEHQLRALAWAGVRRVVMVVGHEHRRVGTVVDRRARLILNERYAETNSLFSFLLARDAIDDDVIVCNCDVLFHRDVLGLLVEARRCVVAYDSGCGLDAEAMKVELEGDRLVGMSKQLPGERAYGENVGLIRLDSRVARMAFRAAAACVGAGCERDWLATAINSVAATGALRAVDVDPLPWTEIDFPEDLAHARHVVWPAICATPVSRPKVPAFGLREPAARVVAA